MGACPVEADAIIIGSGQAGVPLALKLVAVGKRVLREVDEPAGLLKVRIDPSTERVLGAAIFDAQFVHPTFAEGVQSVVMGLPRFSS